MMPGIVISSAPWPSSLIPKQTTHWPKWHGPWKWWSSEKPQALSCSPLAGSQNPGSLLRRF